MKSKELAILRHMLEDQLYELGLRAESTISELLNTTTDNESDPIDRATSEQSRTNTLRLRERERRLINKIRNCLRAMDNDEYGTCERCGESIFFARLKARPVTNYCIDCKEELEKLEKNAGY